MCLRSRNHFPLCPFMSVRRSAFGRLVARGHTQGDGQHSKECVVTSACRQFACFHSGSVLVYCSARATTWTFRISIATCSSVPAHATACSRVSNTGMNRCGPSGGHISGMPCAVVILSHACAFITAHNAEQGAGANDAGASSCLGWCLSGVMAQLGGSPKGGGGCPRQALCPHASAKDIHRPIERGGLHILP